MRIKKGDKVIALTGKDKGKTGKVLKVVAEKNMAIVEGINLRYKHLRPKKQGEKGQKVQFPSGINLSNIALIDPKTNKPTRVSIKVENGKKVRISKKSKQTI